MFVILKRQAIIWTMKYLHLSSHSYKIECGISNTVIIGMNILFDK